MPANKPSSKPLVSIIVSCYNHEQYITECIESIIHQTYNNIELIVIDDGSTDNSPEILDDLSQQYQFYYEHQENMGLTRTLNKALEKAKGQYIAPLGSDDIIMLDKTAKQVAFLEQRNDIAVLGGNILVIDEQGIIKPKQKFAAYHEEDFNSIFLNPKKIPAAPSVMIRADALRSVNGYSTESNLEDIDLWLKITHAGFKIAILNDILCYYREHPSNSYKDYRFMTESLLQIYSRYENEPEYLQVKNQILLRMFLKVAKKDRQYAWEIMKQISPRYYKLKFFRAFFHMLLPKPSSR